MSRRCLLVLCALGLPLAAGAPAAASRDQESIFEDEHQLLESGPGVASAALDDIDALGADSVRSLVLWSRVAPARKGQPYSPGAWDPYDDLVRVPRSPAAGWG